MSLGSLMWVTFHFIFRMHKVHSMVVAWQDYVMPTQAHACCNSQHLFRTFCVFFQGRLEDGFCLFESWTCKLLLCPCGRSRVIELSVCFQAFIENYGQLVPDIVQLARHNISLSDVQESLLWFRTLQTLPLSKPVTADTWFRNGCKYN